MRTGPMVLPLFDQIGKRFIHECLELPSLDLREPADSRQDFRSPPSRWYYILTITPQ